MSRPDGFSRPATPETDPAVPEADPMMDPDATRIVPAGKPLDRMPADTAANRREPLTPPTVAAASPVAPASAADAPLPEVEPSAPMEPIDVAEIHDPNYPDTHPLRARQRAEAAALAARQAAEAAPAPAEAPAAEPVVAEAPVAPPVVAQAPAPAQVPVPVPPAVAPAAPVTPSHAASDDATVIVSSAAFKPAPVAPTPVATPSPMPAPAPTPAPVAAATPSTPPASQPIPAPVPPAVVTPAPVPRPAAAPVAASASTASTAPAASTGESSPIISAPVTISARSGLSAAALAAAAAAPTSEGADSEFAETRFDPELQAQAEAAWRNAGTLPGGPLMGGPGGGSTTSMGAGRAPSADMPVRQVGRYEIRERLGRGGMASVFKAHDPGIGRDVAIKFLHASLCEDEEYRARFLREARASGGLSHPNIVTVHDVGEIDGRPYMAMELLDGESLADVLEPGKPLPVRDTVVMAIQLARALDYSHKRGIVHRDIKPGNIARTRGTLDIKVMDFGIAHMESTKGEQRTRVGDVLGTPQYMSPEQMNGEKIDGRSDLFSVGIVLYQMLTGQRPFSGDSVVNLALKIAKEDPTPLNKLRPGLPASLRRVVDRCLAKAPDDRFATGADVADALTRVLSELDEEATASNRPRIIPLRVKWTAMMATIVAIVMAVTCTIIIQRQYAAMMQQVADTGAALSRFIGVQNATPALGEDWVTVDVSLQEIMKTGDFQSLTISDRGGVVRASSVPETVGRTYQTPAGEVLGDLGGVKRTRYMAHGEPVLGFESDILYQDKVVGHLALALRERPLETVARLSRTLMAALAVITVLAVAIAMYVVGNWFSRPIKLMNEALGEIARGRYGFRIREQRKDEFGLLYATFDQMAQALQDRQALAAGQARPDTIRTTAALTAASRDKSPSADDKARRASRDKDGRSDKPADKSVKAEKSDKGEKGDKGHPHGGKGS